MMNTSRKNGGFTLMELLVTIVTASIVTLAATTILLLGMRINRQSIDTASRQTTARILLSAVESIATEGEITGVEAEMETWKIIGGDRTLFSYNGKAIYTGDYPIDESASVEPFLDGVIASYVELNGKLLTVSLKTEDGGYITSVYCRTLPDIYKNKHDPDDDDVEDILTPVGGTGNVKRSDAFLKVLASQYWIDTIVNDQEKKLRNTGLIVSDGASTGQYYSQWYLGGTYSNGWNSQTPWCACFISWGLNQVLGDSAPKYANVDTFMNALKNNNGGNWVESLYYDNNAEEPKAGDLIFFDWTINSVQNPEHIGAVLKLDDEDKDGKLDYVYTIEGNSDGRVAVRKYMLNDPRIIGYGVLDWQVTS